MPKYPTEQINRELVRLAGSGLVCAEYYLRRELGRRAASAKNPGRKRKRDTPQRKVWREASRKYREVHQKDDASSQSYDRDEGTGGA